jgi:hypothetical protein
LRHHDFPLRFPPYEAQQGDLQHGGVDYVRFSMLSFQAASTAREKAGYLTPEQEIPDF